MSLSAIESRPAPRWVIPVVLGVLLLIFFATRLYNLLALPQFTDEAGHMQVAWHIANGAKKWRLMSDGRVLCAWFPALAITWANDPLWASRYFSTLAGATTMLALFACARRMFSIQAAVCTALACIVCPYFVTYDRMVMAEPYLCAAIALMFWAGVRLAQEPTQMNAALFAFCMGLVPLGKIPGIMMFPLPFVYAFFVQHARPFPWKIWLMAYGAGTALVAFPLYLFLKNTPQLRLKSVASSGQSVPFFDNFLNNLHRANEWLTAYWSIGLIALALLGLLFLLVQKRWLAVWLAAGMLIPVLAFSLLAHFWVPRYLIFSSLPMVLAAGYGAAKLMEILGSRAGSARMAVQTLVAMGLLALAIIPAWAMDSKLLTDAANTPFVRDDRTEYVENWASGYTKDEAFKILQDALAKEPAGMNLMVHDGLPETLTTQFDIYFKRNSKMHLSFADLDDPKALEKLDALRAQLPTWVFWYDMNTLGPGNEEPRWHVKPASLKAIESRGKLFYAGKKPTGNPGAMLYQLEALPSKAETR